MDAVSKVEYNVRNLTTRSVTLFPTRAQISRDIKDVPLKPGLNEITILGLSPTVDEHSIRVDGSGSAIISDIAVESLPNRDIFDEIYPEDEEDLSDEDGNPADDEEPDFPVNEELKAARLKSKQLQTKVHEANDAHSAAQTQLRILDDYARTLKGGDGTVIEDFLESYKTASSRVRDDWFAAQTLREEISTELDDANKELARLEKKYQAEKKAASRAWRKATLARTKAKIHVARKEEERTKEKVRVREEREKFWPKNCFAVRIQLTMNAAVHTPMSSRRGSVSSETEFHLSPADAEASTSAATPATTCNLVLSYVTASASWTPSYDLQLSTATGSGTLCFDAQLNNSTSETWNKCRITLSTSQVSTSSLEETVPALVPWHLKAQKASNGKGSGGLSDKDILRSREEANHNLNFWRSQQPAAAKHKRKNLFGVEESVPHSLQDYQMQLMLLEQQNKKRLCMARQEQTAPTGGGLFGNNNNNNAPVPPPPAASAFAAAPAANPSPAQRAAQQQQAMLHQQQQARQQMAQQARAAVGSQGAVVGSQGRPPQQMQQQQMQQQQMQTQQQQQRAATHDNFAAMDMNPLQNSGDALNDFDFDSFLNDKSQDQPFDFNGAFDEPKLDFEESMVDESGFTTTYDLPGLKTLVPKSTSSKQRVARINLSKVTFSHTVLAKYRPVAHLSAKILNGSRLTLLKGPVGVTLDGSFMGRTNLPRCGGGESINLGLGADQTIRVTYPKPEAKRATTGYFTKEDIRIFERCIRLENTKSTTTTSSSGNNVGTVKILVLDQIPVADSERVRIELLKPEGLAIGGEYKKAGIPGKVSDAANTSRDAGAGDKAKAVEDDGGATAMAALKKKGEVNWTVTLRPGRAVQLPLEYLVAVPIGEQAVQS